MDTEIAAVLALAEELRLAPQIQSGIREIAVPEFFLRYGAQIQALTAYDTAMEAWQDLQAQFAGEDPDGIRILTAYLAAGCRNREAFRAAGIPDSVYLATMGCFPRFLGEALRNTGRHWFDRDYWAWRNICLRIFRLGTLEYEYLQAVPGIPGVNPGAPVLSVHIPSDASLTPEAVHASYLEAERFFAREGKCFCLWGQPQAMVCESWLLSPELHKLLDPDSRILGFASEYEIFEVQPDNEGFYRFLFQQHRENLPQNTSLQRRAAAHLQAGGKLGGAFGIKKGFPSGKIV